MLNKYENRHKPGTYDGAAAMADMSGLSRAEVYWTWERLKTLRAAGIDKEEAKDIVAREALSKPWEAR